MACATIHLAIAKKYLKKHSSLNYDEFIAGTLYPDAAEDKDQSHYTDKNRVKDNISHVQGKVNLYAFLKDHDSLDDFDLGWFLHLVTDYLFFKECFTDEYLLKTSYEDFCKDLYFAYDCFYEYLSKKYEITLDDYKAYPSEHYPGSSYKKCILTKKLVNHFINKVSKIDIDKYILLILEKGKNIDPSVL